MASKGILDPYTGAAAPRCRHDMVVTWCAWCGGTPEWAPLDNGRDRERTTEAPDGSTTCAGCEGPITPCGSADRDTGENALCWRCID